MLRVSPVSGLFRVMVALGTTAPEASLIVPATSPVVIVCANAGIASIAAANKSADRAENLVSLKIPPQPYATWNDSVVPTDRTANSARARTRSTNPVRFPGIVQNLPRDCKLFLEISCRPQNKRAGAFRPGPFPYFVGRAARR